MVCAPAQTSCLSAKTAVKRAPLSTSLRCQPDPFAAKCSSLPVRTLHEEAEGEGAATTASSLVRSCAPAREDGAAMSAVSDCAVLAGACFCAATFASSFFRVISFAVLAALSVLAFGGGLFISNLSLAAYLAAALGSEAGAEGAGAAADFA